ncbi:MAG: flagellar biosynthetic protein FliR [Desulfobacteraceae bacterium]|nr:flagellar biosynthetic protein FliR [Desulfobacteraceae bacterium]
MLLLNLPLDQLQAFIFVLVRVGAILFSIPFLEARNVPSLLKATLALAVSLMLMPQLQLREVSLIDSPWTLAGGLVGEALVGIMIGLVVQLLFSGVQLAGQLAGFQMGIAIANVVDPSSSLQIPVLAQFLNLFALLIFFAIDAHFYFIKGLVESFSLIPPLGVHFKGEVLDLLIKMMANVFISSLQLGAPVMAALLLTNVALGFTARTVPQMQIFVVAMPLQIILGLIFLGLSLPFIKAALQISFNAFDNSLIDLIKLFR